MNKYSILFFLLLLTGNLSSKPLPYKPKHIVIIDTDCAIDDMRALSLLLSRPEISIKAILLSDGTLPPNEGSERVKMLLNEFNYNNILLACGDTLQEINPPWRHFNRQFVWGDATEQQSSCPDAVQYLIEALNKTNEKTTIICLGPLTNIGQFIKKDAGLLSKVDRIIWYNESVKPLHGFNYECDKNAADIVIKSGVRIDVISNLQKENIIFDTSLYKLCKNSNTLLAKILFKVHSQPAVLERIKQGHFRLSDELVSVYLTNPELFDMNPLIPEVNVRYTQDYNSIAVKEAISDMIDGLYLTSSNVVFNSFPTQRQMFTYDVRQIMDSVISLYGFDEWKANVMTDEFHGHLGVFSIVGAKMGIRARELFGVGPDVLEVISYAGTKPPYSCLNDGIQVSTGATLGMGTIHLAMDTLTQPMAIFSYKSRSIRIRLKEEYLNKVDEDIKNGIVKFGLMDDGYWKLIRRNALKYWLEWDRNKIFEIEEIRIP
jgi:pyrimidine-specific ribonucleoside hydrolase